jgi:hypothetical protein
MFLVRRNEEMKLRCGETLNGDSTEWRQTERSGGQQSSFGRLTYRNLIPIGFCLNFKAAIRD